MFFSGKKRATHRRYVAKLGLFFLFQFGFFTNLVICSNFINWFLTIIKIIINNKTIKSSPLVDFILSAIKAKYRTKSELAKIQVVSPIGNLCSDRKKPNIGRIIWSMGKALKGGK